MKTIKYYSAVWCGPCKMFKPVMQQLQSEGLNIQFIDIDDSRDEAIQAQVKAVPTCIIFNNGVEVDRWTGPKPKEEVRRRYNGI